MNNILTTLLTLIESLLPSITSAPVVQKVLNVLTQFLPFIISEVRDLAQPVKNIIAALSANPAATSEQIASLEALDAKVDAEFEAAAAAALAEDAAADLDAKTN